MPQDAHGLHRVRRALAESGAKCDVLELPASTRSAHEAASAIGCTVEQIAKSIVFRGSRTSDPILVIASGGNRVDERIIAQAVGEPIQKADAKFIREQTGFAIGGVAPIAHLTPIRIFVDSDLARHSEIWAAAGYAPCGLSS